MTALQKLASDLPEGLTVVDVGCRWGFGSHWQPLAPHVRLVGFDADEREILRLQEAFGAESHMHFFARTLGPAPGRTTFVRTREPAGASVYAPDRERTAHLPENTGADITDEIEVDLSTLDEWMSEATTPRVDALKLDTQGSELDILRGSSLALGTVRHIEVEVAFNEIFRGAPLYGEVDAFLRSHGFALWRFRDLVTHALREVPNPPTSTEYHWYEANVRPISVPGGQLVWCNAHFIRREVYSESSHVEWETRLRDACLFTALEFYDLAILSLNSLLANTAAPASMRRHAGALLAEISSRPSSFGTPDLCADRAESNPLAASQELRRLQSQLDEARTLASAMEGTFSWRLTRPLRSLRRVQKRVVAHRTSPAPAQGSTRPRPNGLEHFADRVEVVSSLLDPSAFEGAAQDGVPIQDALARLERAALATSARPETIAWLSLLAATCTYPDAPEYRNLARSLRITGPSVLKPTLWARFDEAGFATSYDLQILRDRVVVDASQILSSSIHTGIQRVAREAVAQWLETDQSICVAYFDRNIGALRQAAADECDRIRNWRTNEDITSDRLIFRTPEARDSIVVPWSCNVISLEIPEPSHSRGLLSLRDSGIARSLSLIGFDLIPLLASELVPRELSLSFLDYAALVRHADRISAISYQSERDFRALASTLESEGRPSPKIQAHPLVTPPPPLEESDIAAAKQSLELAGPPLVLVVGVQEARKNHLAVLDAAGQLWDDGYAFELLFIGGMPYDTGDIVVREVERLAQAGRPVRIKRRVSEPQLWAAYRAARFTVFPSLLEGFGLPIVESLVSGTPVITSNYGSMAEIAQGGGALLVDPRSIDDIQTQMGRLLSNEELLQKLRAEARGRDFGSWDAYARDVWNFFNEEDAVPQR